MTDQAPDRRAAIEVAIRRRAGASPEHAAQVRDNMMCQADLRATCRGCGTIRRGDINELQKPCAGCGFPAREKHDRNTR